jgi:hypothetical protein
MAMLRYQCLICENSNSSANEKWINTSADRSNFGREIGAERDNRRTKTTSYPSPSIKRMRFFQRHTVCFSIQNRFFPRLSEHSALCDVIPLTRSLGIWWSHGSDPKEHELASEQHLFVPADFSSNSTCNFLNVFLSARSSQSLKKFEYWEGDATNMRIAIGYKGENRETRWTLLESCASPMCTFADAICASRFCSSTTDFPSIPSISCLDPSPKEKADASQHDAPKDVGRKIANQERFEVCQWRPFVRSPMQLVLVCHLPQLLDWLVDQNAFEKVVSKNGWIKMRSKSESFEIRAEDIEARNKIGQDLFGFAWSIDCNCVLRMTIERWGEEIRAKRATVDRRRFISDDIAKIVG